MARRRAGRRAPSTFGTVSGPGGSYHVSTIPMPLDGEVTTPETVPASPSSAPPTHQEEEELMSTTTPSPPAAAHLAVVPSTGTAFSVPPPGVPLSAEEWEAMSPVERQNALDFFREENAATTEGVAVTFPKIAYPTSGASFFEVPTLTGEPEARRTLEAVVVFKQPVRGYWPPRSDQEVGATQTGTLRSDPPTCSSRDGITPEYDSPQRQASTCATCRWSQWGTGKNGRGQACKARLQCFLLFEGEEIPTLFSVPPTQLNAFADYAVQLRKHRIPLIAVTTIFGLVDARSAGGDAYKALTLKTGPPVAYAEMLRARAIREAFSEHMRRRGVQVDEAAADEPAGTGAGGAVIYGESARVVVDEPGANDSPF